MSVRYLIMPKRKCRDPQSDQNQHGSTCRGLVSRGSSMSPVTRYCQFLAPTT